MGARKDGSGLLESVEAGNWMVHVDLRDFLNRDLGIYIYHGYETKDRTGKNNLIEWKEKGHFLCRGNMRVTEVGWFDSQYEQTMPNTAAHLRIYAVFAIYASQIQSLCIFLCKHLSPFEFNTIGRLP